MKITKNFFGKGYKVHIDNMDEAWHLHSDLAQTVRFFDDSERMGEEVKKALKDGSISTAWLPGLRKIEELSNITREVNYSLLNKWSSNDIKENFQAWFIFIAIIVLNLTGIITLSGVFYRFLEGF